LQYLETALKNGNEKDQGISSCFVADSEKKNKIQKDVALTSDFFMLEKI
jgi:hypothetical protein